MVHMQPRGFNYIVIGAGFAGGLLILRLSQNLDLRILLLDASGVDHWQVKLPDLICERGGSDRRRPGIENNVLGTT